MSPIELRVLLHHYYSSANWSDENPSSHAAGNAAAYWRDNGCLEDVDDSDRRSGLRLTARGHAMVALWLRQELPQQVWVDSAGQPIDVK